MTKLEMLTPRTTTLCSATTRKPRRSKKGRAVMLASVKMRPNPWRRASLSTCSPQLVGQAEVVDDEASWLVLEDAIDAGYGLHEAVGAHWFVEVHGV
jgi:hypothetical protein